MSCMPIGRCINKHHRVCNISWQRCARRLVAIDLFIPRATRLVFHRTINFLSNFSLQLASSDNLPCRIASSVWAYCVVRFAPLKYGAQPCGKHAVSQSCYIKKGNGSPYSVADLGGGCGGCGRTHLGVLPKNSRSTNFKNSEDSRQQTARLLLLPIFTAKFS